MISTQGWFNQKLKSIWLFVRRSLGKGRTFGLRVLYAIGVANSVCQVEVFKYSGSEKLSSSDPRPSILVVAPGIMTIPPRGWGAVETVIDEQITHLSKTFDVTLLNSARIYDWIRIRPWKYSAMLVHYEDWLPRSFIIRRIFSIPVVACSHYGYLQQPSVWYPSFRRRFRWLLKTDGFLALNPSIKSLIVSSNYKGLCALSPNGSDSKFNTFDSDNGRVICLGKVEVRKKQFELFQTDNSGRIDFVGPIVDPRVTALVSMGIPGSDRFKGPWSRDQLRSHLGNYATLILASDGEADALVLYEAQLAGLSIICSPEASGSQNFELPWVLLGAVDSASELETTLEKGLAVRRDLHREIIRFSEISYGWNVRIMPVIETLNKVVGSHN